MCTFLKGAGKTLLCFAPLFFIQHFVLLHLPCVEHQLTYTYSSSSSSSSSASAMTTTTSPVPHRSLLELSRSVENITRVLRDESSPPARPSLRTRRRSSLKPTKTNDRSEPVIEKWVHVDITSKPARKSVIEELKEKYEAKLATEREAAASFRNMGCPPANGGKGRKSGGLRLSAGRKRPRWESGPPGRGNLPQEGLPALLWPLFA